MSLKIRFEEIPWGESPKDEQRKVRLIEGKPVKREERTYTKARLCGNEYLE